MDDMERADDPSAGAAAARPSDRLRLEVELLATPELDPHRRPPGTTPGHHLHVVLVALAEPDLAAYVRSCLWARADLLPVEPAPGEAAAAAVRRLRPALLVTETGAAGQLPQDSTLPVLLLVQDVGEDGGLARATPSPAAVLPLPFNAHRLLAAVATLLGQGGNLQPP